MPILLLLRAKLEGTTFLGGGFSRLRERDQVWVVPIAIIGAAVGLIGFAAVLYQNYVGMAALGEAFGYADLPMYVATLATWVLVFVLGFPIAVSVLYFSRDTRLLASLPIRPAAIVTVNTAVLYLYALPVAAFLFIPALVAGWGTLTAAGSSPFALVVTALLAVIVLPVVPLALSVLVVTAVTRLVNLSRFRTNLEALGMLLVLVVLVGFQVALSRSLVDGSGTAQTSTTEYLASVVVRLRTAVGPAGWFARAFLPGGWLMLVLAVVVSVLSGAVAVAAVQNGYLRQIADQAVSRAHRRRGAPGAIPNQRRPLASLVHREVALLTSNSTFLFESAGELVVFPLLLVIARLSIPADVMAGVSPLLSQTGYALPVVTAALVLLAGINTVSSAALSREGRTFDLSLSLPLSGSMQISAKILTYLALFGATFLVNAFLAVWLLSAPWWYGPVIVACGLPFVWLIGVTTIVADIRRPRLDWNHPQQAVKQNMNVVVGMGIAVVALAAAAAPAFYAALRGAPSVTVLLLAAGTASVLAIVASGQVKRYADRRYGNAFSAA
jgi:ABC-2 type transport system permease protein